MVRFLKHVNILLIFSLIAWHPVAAVLITLTVQNVSPSQFNGTVTLFKAEEIPNGLDISGSFVPQKTNDILLLYLKEE